MEKDVEYQRESLFTRYQIETKLGNKKVVILIIGQDDKILRSGGSLIIEDSKYPNDTWKYLEKVEPYKDQVLRALLYLNSNFTKNNTSGPEEWFRIRHERKGWVINIKDKNTREGINIFRGIQTKEAEEFLKQKLAKFVLIALGKPEPEHHKNLNKCQKRIDRRTRMLAAGLRELFILGEDYISMVACQDKIDVAILSALREAGAIGRQSGELAAQLDIDHRDISLRIHRMNKGMQREIGENIIQKCGHKWKLIPRLRQDFIS